MNSEDTSKRHSDTVASPSQPSSVSLGRVGRGRPSRSARAPVGIQSLEIGMDVLQGMIEHGAEISLADLSRRVGLAASKLHRYLVSLQRAGMVVQSPSSSLYNLGPMARLVGAAAFARYEPLALAHEEIKSIAQDTGHSVFLYIWTELGPTLLRVQPGAYSMPVMLHPGAVIPLSDSVVGRLMLAYLPVNLTRPLIQREAELAAADNRPFWSHDDRQAAINDIRRQSVYWSRGIVPGDVAAVPILDDRGNIRCVVGAVLAAGRSVIDHDVVDRRLREAVERFSHSADHGV